ncbi:MAG: hypothetical protein R1F52_04415 [Candidatus Nitrosoabyssus spongiisocia]|nr:MAG: hypothetical protein R1F52_04415 [Nitrosopumilaceae archaeon AB1(1)]
MDRQLIILDMSTPELLQQIQNGIEKYKDSKMVAFLGVAGSGKTVISAITARTLFKSFIPNSNGKWLGVYTSGDQKINDIIRDMKRGKFPPHTPGEEYPDLTIEIHNTEGVPVKFELKLNDMSGENYETFLVDAYPDIDERLNTILSCGADYLAFAKKYVIIIDCAKIEDWDTDIASVNKMIMNIRKIKNKIHHFDEDEKMKETIAIIFNKSDLLSRDKQTIAVVDELSTDKQEITVDELSTDKQEITVDELSTDNQEITVDELADLYLGLKSSLTINVPKNNYTFFKLSVQSTSIASNKLKVKLPLSYTESEYNKFISWIFDVDSNE